MRARDGRVLAPVLLGLTAVTGLVDAVSYLALGHVFTANMTGNVVFLEGGHDRGTTPSQATILPLLRSQFRGSVASGFPRRGLVGDFT